MPPPTHSNNDVPYYILLFKTAIQTKYKIHRRNRIERISFMHCKIQRIIAMKQVMKTSASMSRVFSNVPLAFSFSSASTVQANIRSDDSTDTSFASLQEQYRKDILNSSLNQVHEYGWTEDAIAHGIVSNPTKKYPPTFIGMMNDNHSKSSDLIHFFMKESNLKLNLHINELRIKEQAKDNKDVHSMFSPSSHSKLLKYGIQYRLEMVVPFVQSNRWSEGMALGAKPYNAMSTATHLEEIVNILQDSLRDENGYQIILSPLQRAAIGAVYVTTELHLLADTSPQYQDTWNFLSNRIDELDSMQQSQSFLPQFNQDTVVAGVAVASSLGGAVLSLMTPVAKNGFSAMAGMIVPQVMTAMSNVSNVSSSFSTQPPGTAAKDYDVSDLPPFEDTTSGSK